MIVIGSYGDDNNGSLSGSAYVFTTSGEHVSKITAKDGAASDYFGSAVGVSGNVIVIGAYRNDDNGSASGSDYIFTTSGEYVNKITAPDGAAEDYFGWSAGVPGDMIVIGAGRDDDNGSKSGSAYIFPTSGE